MNAAAASQMQPSGAFICTDLYPIEDSRTARNDTFAVRDLVEGAMASGAEIRGVVRFKPLLSQKAINFPRLHRVSGIPVIESPRIGTLNAFSESITRLVLNRTYDLDPPAKIYVCHLSKSFYMAKRVFGDTGSRFVFVVHSSDIDYPLLNWCLQRSDAIYCRSHALSSRLEELGYRCKGVVGSGVPHRDFGTSTKMMCDDVVRIVLATRLIPLRNVIQCLEAIRRLPTNIQAYVEIFGEGPLEVQVRKFIDENGMTDRVSMHGFRPRHEVLEAMSRAHLFLMPSAPETLGLAYLEAMAKGCVVVGHKGWGIDGIVTDAVNGYLVPSPDPTHILDRILSYLSSDRAALHRRSFSTAKQHTAEDAAFRYARMIELELSAS